MEIRINATTWIKAHPDESVRICGDAQCITLPTKNVLSPVGIDLDLPQKTTTVRTTVTFSGEAATRTIPITVRSHESPCPPHPACGCGSLYYGTLEIGADGTLSAR